MPDFILGLTRFTLGAWMVLSIAPLSFATDQAGGNISEFFEGKTVVVKMDMPGTQQGVDVYPQRPQPLDFKSYSNRMRQFGPSIHNGDSVMVTKVKVKDDNIEFQLAGGGYGASGDDTDTSVHFTPAERSGHEKELESRIKSETNPDRRRGMQRELEDMRSYREARDRRDREIAEQAAAAKAQMVMSRRMQGGSRFNLRIDAKKGGDAITPQLVMASLANYVAFPMDPGGGSQSARVAPVDQGNGPAPADPSLSLRKGLTREQVESLYGQPSEVHQSNQNGLTIVSCTYPNKDTVVKADFVNGVLVQYSVSSR